MLLSYYSVFCLLAGQWRKIWFLPYVQLINCHFHLFDLQLSPSAPNIFFCFSNHQRAVFFLFFLFLSLQSSVLQWHQLISTTIGIGGKGYYRIICTPLSLAKQKHEATVLTLAFISSVSTDCFKIISHTSGVFRTPNNSTSTWPQILTSSMASLLARPQPTGFLSLGNQTQSIHT